VKTPAKDIGKRYVGIFPHNAEFSLKFSRQEYLWRAVLFLSQENTHINTRQFCREFEGTCFPVPDEASFTLLNNKHRFTDLCQQLGVPTPRTRLLSGKQEVRRERAPHPARLTAAGSISGPPRRIQLALIRLPRLPRHAMVPNHAALLSHSACRDGLPP